MAWNTVTDVNDGQSFGGAAWQSAIDAVTQIQDAIGPDENALDFAFCQVSTSTGNTLTSGSSATIAWETEVSDTLGWHAPGGTQIIPTIAGWGRVGVRGSTSADPDADFTLFQLRVQKNGADLHVMTIRPPAVSTTGCGLFGTTPLIQVNGSSDALRIVAAQINTDADPYTFTGYFDFALEFRT